MSVHLFSQMFNKVRFNLKNEGFSSVLPGSSARLWTKWGYNSQIEENPNPSLKSRAHRESGLPQTGRPFPDTQRDQKSSTKCKTHDKERKSQSPSPGSSGWHQQAWSGGKVWRQINNFGRGSSFEFGANFIKSSRMRLVFTHIAWKTVFALQ